MCVAPIHLCWQGICSPQGRRSAHVAAPTAGNTPSPVPVGQCLVVILGRFQNRTRDSAWVCPVPESGLAAGRGSQEQRRVGEGKNVLLPAQSPGLPSAPRGPFPSDPLSLLSIRLHSGSSEGVAGSGGGNGHRAPSQPYRVLHTCPLAPSPLSTKLPQGPVRPAAGQGSGLGPDQTQPRLGPFADQPGPSCVSLPPSVAASREGKRLPPVARVALRDTGGFPPNSLLALALTQHYEFRWPQAVQRATASPLSAPLPLVT